MAGSMSLTSGTTDMRTPKERQNNSLINVLDNTDEELHGLVDIIDILFSKLSPVLRDEASDVMSPMPEPAAGSELGSRLLRQQNNLHSSVTRLRDLNIRIDL